MSKSLAPYSSFLLLLLGSACSLAEEWPQFRGPGGQGHAETSGLPLNWSESENITWKTPLPGKGWSSPVIGGNEIWMTAAVEAVSSPEEKEKRLKTNTGSQPLQVADSLEMYALCVDRTTGKLLHNILIMKKESPQPTHTLNSYASPSPILEAGRLYCHFGSYGTCCLDVKSGEVLWKNQDLVIAHENGPGGTPILWEDKLIFHCDGSDQQYMAALDKNTGKLAWKTNRSGKMHDDPQLKKAYGTPLVVEENGKPVVVSPAADWLYGYDPKSGNELWRVPYNVLGFSIVPRPVFGHGMVYICTTYLRCELLAVKLNGEKNPEIAWRYNRQMPNIPSPLLVGEEIYLVSDRGIATCLNALTGEEIWTERLGGNFCASPLYADGKIYCFSREGETQVFSPGKSFKQLAKNQLDGSFMASAAALDGAFYLRTDKALYRIEEK